MSDGGKGSKRRPSQVSDAELQKRWDDAFNEKRIDIIGSNGNTGAHYPSIDDAYERVEKDYKEK